MAGLTLDSGALIAAERGDRRFWACWKEAVRRDVDVTVPAGVVAQTWRGNSPVIARVLKASIVDPLDEHAARRTGELLATARASDVIDAHTALGASRRSDAILTSDPEDLRHLTSCLSTDLPILEM